MNTLSQKLSVGEKIGYSLGDFAANLVFQTLVTYLAYFYTDIYELKASHASLIILVVGLVAAFAFNPIIGALADRTRSRWGKFRPWILWTAIPLGVLSFLAFSKPGFTNYNSLLLYTVVTYTLLLLLYAANNLPYGALSGVITGDMKERNSVSKYRFTAVMLAQLFVQVFMLPIIMYIGAKKTGLSGEEGSAAVKAAGTRVVMFWLSIVGTLMLVITFFSTRERIVPKPEQESALRQDLSDLSKNKPWIIMLVLTTLVFITLALKGGAYVYYFQNYVDKARLATFIQPVLNGFDHVGMNFFGNDPVSAGLGLFNAGGILCMIIGISLSKPLADKYGKRDVFGITLVISTLFILAFYAFQPQSVGLMFVSQILHGFFYGITIPLLWAMIADVADFSEWKNNRRATAIIFSAMMVGLKAGLSLGSSLLTFLLGKYQYVANSEIVQPDTAVQGIRMLVSVFPAIPFLAGAALLFFYEINKKKEVQIETDLKQRRAIA